LNKLDTLWDNFNLSDIWCEECGLLKATLSKATNLSFTLAGNSGPVHFCDHSHCSTAVTPACLSCAIR